MTTLPYTYIQCPCSDPSTLSNRGPAEANSAASPTEDEGGLEEDDDNTFDPRAPRSNYSLYPIEYLLYCEDCHQIRCPRCIAEEVVTYFCPHCLFEVPSSNIKSEGNRCTRNCFHCPICIGPLTLATAEQPPARSAAHSAENASSSANAHGGPFILSCGYCQWSSNEIGIQLEKPNAVHTQLSRLRNGGRPRLTPKERKELRRKDSTTAAPSTAPLLGGGDAAADQNGVGAAGSGHDDNSKEDDGEMDIETQFANLKTFYQGQMENNSSSGLGGLSALGDLGFSSPGSLSRIMSLYAGGSSFADKRNKARPGIMREALDTDEGLKILRRPAVFSLENGSASLPDGLDERRAIEKLQREGWDGTASAAMRTAQAFNVGSEDLKGRARFQDELRPIPFLLRTKRSKRCPICRHIVTKPEAKVASTRFRIRLVASSYMPSISVRPLVLNGNSGNAAAGGSVAGAGGGSDPLLLKPLEPAQFLLTFKNPIFESVRVSIATPATTPGRFASRVTVLCPAFEIGANTDMWDDPALREGSAAGSGSGGASGAAERRKDRDGRGGEGDGGSVVEAGKIWERGRNWVTVVVEVVPPSLRTDLLGIGLPADQVDRSPLRVDEDLVEIPMFVRVEWEADAAGDDVGHAPGKEKDGREKRELAYWVVVGVGRIQQD